jgi:REP element-mobilizing transposase RayT
VSATFFRRRLPHYDPSVATYFVTACLAGSAPALGRLSLRREGAESSLRQQQVFRAREDWLDSHCTVRWLDDRRLAAIVAHEIRHRSNAWYDLHAYVVMPSHIHCIFSPRRDWAATLPATPTSAAGARSMIMRSLKGRTAKACNRLLNTTGAFWQAESYDRAIRNEAELARFVTYVEFNPVKAGLCERPEEWEFSSAYAVAQHPFAG